MLQALSTTPRIYLVDDFATPAEIAHVLELASDTQALATQGIEAQHNFTGFSFEMPVNDSVLTSLTERTYELVRMGNRCGATLRFRRYAPGEYHPLHLDTYKILDWTLIRTALLYLTDVADGGETHFPQAQPAPVSVKPKAGRLVMWFNHLADGSVDQRSIHESLPVKNGEKATLTNFVYQSLDRCGVELKQRPFPD